jgi:hypothetical protein
MTTRGYIALARGILDHPIVGARKPFDYLAAWVWLLFEAAWKERRVRVTNGRTISALQLNRGQLSYSRGYMATAWGWSHKRVRTFLSRLEKDGMIALQTGQQQTVVTIVNYDAYQPRTKTRGHETDQQWASNGPETEEGKKERKESRAPSDADFGSWYATYPRKKGRKAAERAYLKLMELGEISATDLLARTTAYAESVKAWTPERRQFIPHPATWLNSGRYLDEPDAAPAMAGSPKIEAPTRDHTTFGESDWRECLEQYQQTEKWSARYWGPAPGEPGCLVPAALIVKPITTGPNGERTALPEGGQNFRRSIP